MLCSIDNCLLQPFAFWHDELACSPVWMHQISIDARLPLSVRYCSLSVRRFVTCVGSTLLLHLLLLSELGTCGVCASWIRSIRHAPRSLRLVLTSMSMSCLRQEVDTCAGGHGGRRDSSLG